MAGAITGQQERMRLGYEVKEDIQEIHLGKPAAMKCFHPEDKESPVFLGKQLCKRPTKCITCQPRACVLSQICCRLCLHNAARGLSLSENVVRLVLMQLATAQPVSSPLWQLGIQSPIAEGAERVPASPF